MDIETQQNQTSNSTQKVESHYGVDLTAYDANHVSETDPILANYSEKDMHFAITAIQKGLKPPTRIGIKRTNMRNKKKKEQIEKKNDPQNPYVQPLNPKSPEQICLKALRKESKARIELMRIVCFFALELSQKNSGNSGVMDIEPSCMLQRMQRIFGRSTSNQGESNLPHMLSTKKPSKKQKFIRKKANQKKRREELMKIFRENEPELRQIFPASALQGYNYKCKCPKLSRQQMKTELEKFYAANPERKAQMLKRNQESADAFKARQLKRQLRAEKGTSGFDNRNRFGSYGQRRIRRIHKKF